MASADLVTKLAARGRYHFTTEEAEAALGSSIAATRAALRRLKRKGVIAVPYRGFHVIVPPEYRRLGCLPAEQFVPQLMEHLRQPYYVALLSAARYHGAAHQQPQLFHVMVPKYRPPLSCGEVRVRFVARHNAQAMATTQFNTPRGQVVVSSPEVTAFDLVGYQEHAGGLDNVATVLAELAEVLRPERLLTAARLSPTPWAQRLGYLLEIVGANGLTDTLAAHVNDTVNETTVLLTGAAAAGAAGSSRWRLMINTKVEPEL
jgi:predicted transcriptional regulator of viral defense system